MTQATETRSPQDILNAARLDSRHKLIRRWFPRLCTIIITVGFLNFILFLAGTFYLGGDAWNGKVEGQRHYVWGYHHGRKGYTEVSESAFRYSMWHVYSVMVTWPLAILAGIAAGRVRPIDG